MIVVLTAFVLGLFATFWMLMLAGLLVHLWPITLVLGLWWLAHRIRKERDEEM